MFLSIRTTHVPATDLGYLLHKHPDRFQSTELSVGKAHVFYTEKNEQACTACLLLDIDPVDMVRSGKDFSGDKFALGQYVNDRPYVASSFMSVAIAKVFSSALNGKCRDKPELATTALPFEVVLEVLPAPRGGEPLIRALFEPLGYTLEVKRHPLDPHFPEWGESRYYSLRLRHTLPLQELLSHLYVLIPTLDHDKHYFVSTDEVEKLLEKGGEWLKNHPEREQITRRYLFRKASFADRALERLSEGETPDETDAAQVPEVVRERRENLHDRRLKAVAERLAAAGAQRVLDLGCGEGRLIRLLLAEKQFTQIVGMDVSFSELQKAADRLRHETMPPSQKARLQFLHGSLTYRDRRLEGFDAAAVVEVIEHLEPNRLKSFEKALFGSARPGTVVLTTPNREYNVMWESLEAGAFRHHDHRFEWTRAEFADWAARVGDRYGYSVEIHPLGDEEPELGAPSQMAVFTLKNL